MSHFGADIFDDDPPPTPPSKGQPPRRPADDAVRPADDRNPPPTVDGDVGRDASELTAAAKGSRKRRTRTPAHASDAAPVPAERAEPKPTEPSTAADRADAAVGQAEPARGDAPAAEEPTGDDRPRRGRRSRGRGRGRDHPIDQEPPPDHETIGHKTIDRDPGEPPRRADRPYAELEPRRQLPPTQPPVDHWPGQGDAQSRDHSGRGGRNPEFQDRSFDDRDQRNQPPRERDRAEREAPRRDHGHRTRQADPDGIRRQEAGPRARGPADDRRSFEGREPPRDRHADQRFDGDRRPRDYDDSRHEPRGRTSAPRNTRGRPAAPLPLPSTERVAVFLDLEALQAEARRQGGELAHRKLLRATAGDRQVVQAVCYLTAATPMSTRRVLTALGFEVRVAPAGQPALVPSVEDLRRAAGRADTLVLAPVSAATAAELDHGNELGSRIEAITFDGTAPSGAVPRRLGREYLFRP